MEGNLTSLKRKIEGLRVVTSFFSNHLGWGDRPANLVPVILLAKLTQAHDPIENRNSIEKAISEKGSIGVICLKAINSRRKYSVIYTLSKSRIYLSFINFYHFYMLSLSVWQDMCLTYKNVVYDLVHHESG